MKAWKRALAACMEREGHGDTLAGIQAEIRPVHETEHRTVGPPEVLWTRDRVYFMVDGEWKSDLAPRPNKAATKAFKERHGIGDET